MNGRKVRIGFLSRHPAPYRDAFLALISQADDLDVKVFLERSNDIGHLYWNLPASRYQPEVLAADHIPSWRVMFTMLRKLVLGGFDYTFWPGFMTGPIITCEFVSALIGRKYVICSDTVSHHGVSGLRGILKRYLIKHAAALIVGGEAGKRFFSAEYNVEAGRMLEGVYSLDGKALEHDIDSLREKKREFRAQMGIGNNETIFLMVANMIPKRHYPITISAFRRFAAQHPRCRFIACGRGDGLTAMQEIAAKDSSIVVVPGVSFREMLKLYAIADVYVHGGIEPASTALQIGAIAKLPLLSSKSVGFAWDLLIEGETGVEVDDYKNAEQWFDGFSRILDMRDKWSEMGKKARALSMKFDADVVADKFIRYFARNRAD